MHDTPNYIGITGFTHRDQIRRVLEATAGHNYTLMAGVLLSDKTFRGLTNKQPHRYPICAAIPTVWCPGAFNVLHYCTDDPTLLHLDEVVRTCELRPGMGLQVNSVWPDSRKLAEIRGREIAVILQVSRGMLEGADGPDWELLASRLTEYRDAADYFLFDPSGGRGRPLPPESAEQVAWVMEKFPDTKCVVAGGLGPATLGCAAPFYAQESLRGRLSCDAESNLRNTDDVLQLAWCLDYINNAARLSRSHARSA